MEMLKKICALMIAVVMVFALTACGGEETESSPAADSASSEGKPADENSATEESTTEEKSSDGKAESEKTAADKFVEANGSAIESKIEAAEGGLDCKVTAEGNKVVVSVLTAKVDGLSDADKSMFQQVYDSMKEELRKTVFDSIGDVKGVDAVVYRICDSKGNKTAELEYEVE